MRVDPAACGLPPPKPAALKRLPTTHGAIRELEARYFFLLWPKGTVALLQRKETLCTMLKDEIEASASQASLRRARVVYEQLIEMHTVTDEELKAAREDLRPHIQPVVDCLARMTKEDTDDLRESDERTLAVSMHGTPKFAADTRASIVARWEEAGRKCRETAEQERQRLQSEADRLRRQN